MTRASVVDGAKQCPKDRDGERWYSLNVHWWDSCVVLGPTRGNPGGSCDVWATGKDFAEAVANAIRFVEKQGHQVDEIGVNT